MEFQKTGRSSSHTYNSLLIIRLNATASRYCHYGLGSIHPLSHLHTLPSYLRACQPILAPILQIPPILRTQAALRTELLLRLTGDLFSSIAGYMPTIDILPVLLDSLDTLDRGSTAVLWAQAWGAENGEGVDVGLDPSTSRRWKVKWIVRCIVSVKISAVSTTVCRLRLCICSGFLLNFLITGEQIPVCVGSRTWPLGHRQWL